MQSELLVSFLAIDAIDDTDYWVYLSSDHLFQVYYKVRQLFLLQSAMVCYYKVRQVLLQSVTILLQSATGITNCDNYYKVRQIFFLQSAMVCYYKVRQVLLQSATGITKCDNFITKCDSFFYYKVRWSVITKCDKCYYKVRQVLQSVTILLQSATGITKCDSTPLPSICLPLINRQRVESMTSPIVLS